MAKLEIICYGQPNRRLIELAQSDQDQAGQGRSSEAAQWWAELRRQPTMQLDQVDVETAAVCLEHGYEWYKQVRPEQLVNGDMLEDLEEEKHDLLWMRTFEGVLPNGWKNRHQIMRDMVKAADLGIQLPTQWITAAAVHCDNNVLEAVSDAQNLRPHQLGMILANPHFIAGNEQIFRDQLIQRQRDKGMSEHDVHNALQVAVELMNKRAQRGMRVKLDRPIAKLSD